MTNLWDPIEVGKMKFSHRLVMAPMTRSRAKPDGVPGDLAAEYYSQRASMGLLITEGTQPSDDGQGYLTTPGIYTPAHIEGWREVTSAVHAAGGSLFIQLMHVGRMSHPDNTPHHRQPVAPSAIAPGVKMFTVKGMQDIPQPRALSTEEVKSTVDDFRRAARAAVDAGADGVEIHGANGYLVHQFLAAHANVRTDEYGGSIENRARFAIEVADAIAREIGPEKTGIRISPFAPIGGIAEGSEAGDVYRHLVSELDKIGLAYVHLMHIGDDTLAADIRKRWSGTLLVLRPNRRLESLPDDVRSGLADMVPVGRLALANPDFIARYRTGAPLNTADPATFYAGGAKGYVDYPTLAGRQPASSPRSE